MNREIKPITRTEAIGMRDLGFRLIGATAHDVPGAIQRVDREEFADVRRRMGVNQLKFLLIRTENRKDLMDAEERRAILMKLATMKKLPNNYVFERAEVWKPVPEESVR
jgi:hypothetical protein